MTALTLLLAGGFVAAATAHVVPPSESCHSYSDGCLRALGDASKSCGAKALCSSLLAASTTAAAAAPYGPTPIAIPPWLAACEGKTSRIKSACSCLVTAVSSSTGPGPTASTTPHVSGTPSSKTTGATGTSSTGTKGYTPSSPTVKPTSTSSSHGTGTATGGSSTTTATPTSTVTTSITSTLIVSCSSWTSASAPCSCPLSTIISTTTSACPSVPPPPTCTASSISVSTLTLSCSATSASSTSDGPSSSSSSSAVPTVTSTTTLACPPEPSTSVCIPSTVTLPPSSVSQPPPSTSTVTVTATSTTTVATPVASACNQLIGNGNFENPNRQLFPWLAAANLPGGGGGLGQDCTACSVYFRIEADQTAAATPAVQFIQGISSCGGNYQLRLKIRSTDRLAWRLDANFTPFGQSAITGGTVFAAVTPGVWSDVSLNPWSLPLAPGRLEIYIQAVQGSVGRRVLEIDDIVLVQV